jgi:hypothetical protein
MYVKRENKLKSAPESCRTKNGKKERIHLHFHTSQPQADNRANFRGESQAFSIIAAAR